MLCSANSNSDSDSISDILDSEKNHTPSKLLPPVQSRAISNPPICFFSPNSKMTLYCLCLKQSRNHQNKSSLFTLQSSKGEPILTFTMEHQLLKSRYPAGFFGKIKKGFSSPGADTKVYAIKIFKKTIPDDPCGALRRAMRAAYVARLLGRTGWVFRHNNKQYLISDWYEGFPLPEQAEKNNQLPVNLNNFSQKIREMPLLPRLKYALDIAYQISVLHKNGLYHGDIKPSNILITATSAFIIDLEGVNLFGSKAVFFTRLFLDNNLKQKYLERHFCLDAKSDLYSLGLSLAFLFPDLLHPIIQNQLFKTDGNISLPLDVIFLEPIEHPLARLIASLVSPAAQERPPLERVITQLKEYYEGLEGSRYLSFMPKKNSLPSGKKAFQEIERQLSQYNHRVSEWFNTRENDSLMSASSRAKDQSFCC